jgi:hypothetical protein
VLVRCTGVGAGRARAWRGVRARSGGRHAGLAEFSRPAPASRLVELLRSAGFPARVDTYTAGTRHRYDIHRVVTPDRAVDVYLREAWRDGYDALCGRPERHLTAWQRQRAERLATAAWRAALLVTGPTRTRSPGLRVPDVDTATALVRAGRLLDLPASVGTRPGGQLLLVLPAGTARSRIEQMLSYVPTTLSAA